MKLKINNQIIANKLKIYKTPFLKFIGLRFSKLKNKEALILKSKKPTFMTIDMFFVFHKLDILWVNKNNLITKVSIAYPFTIKIPKEKSLYVIELQKKTIKKYNIKKGDKVCF